MRRIGFVVVMVLVCGLAVRFAGAEAGDAPGCEGLTAYRTEVFTASQDYLDAIDADGIDLNAGVRTLTSDDWTALAGHTSDFTQALSDITPPAWLQDWHNAQVSRAGALNHLASTAANDGVDAALPIAQTINDLDGSIEALKNAASKTCADAARFFEEWDALDGVNHQGTPVATPVI
jgi:hypothetical protein